MRNFLENFLGKFAFKKKVEETGVICAWCHRHIAEGSPITLYGLYNRVDLQRYPDRFPKGVMIFSENPVVKFVGCSHKDCWSNNDGIFVAGFLRNNKVVLNERPPLKNRYFTKFE